MAVQLKRHDMRQILEKDDLDAFLRKTEKSGFSRDKLFQLMEKESLFIEICFQGSCKILRYLLKEVIAAFNGDVALRLLSQCNENGDNVIMQCVTPWASGDKCHLHGKTVNGKRLKCLELLAESLFARLMRDKDNQDNFYKLLKKENGKEFNVFVICGKYCNYRGFDLLVMIIYGNERRIRAEKERKKQIENYRNGRNYTNFTNDRNDNDKKENLKKEEKLIDLLHLTSVKGKKSFIGRMESGEYKTRYTRSGDQARFAMIYNHWLKILKGKERLSMSSLIINQLNYHQFWQYMRLCDNYLTVTSSKKPTPPEIDNDRIWLNERLYEIKTDDSSDICDIVTTVTDQVIETRTKDGRIIADLTIYESRMACLMGSLNGHGGKYVYISGFNRFWPKTKQFVREKFLYGRILRLGQEQSKDHVSIANNDGIGQFRKYVYCTLSSQPCLSMLVELNTTLFSEDEPIINEWSFIDYKGKFQNININNNDETKSDDLNFEQRRVSTNDENIVIRHNVTDLRNGIKSNGEISNCILDYSGISGIYVHAQRGWLCGVLTQQLTQLTQDTKSDIEKRCIFSMFSS